MPRRGPQGENHGRLSSATDTGSAKRCFDKVSENKSDSREWWPGAMRRKRECHRMPWQAEVTGIDKSVGNRFGPRPGAARRAKTTDGFRQPPTQAAQSAALIRALKINQIVGNGGQGRN